MTDARRESFVPAIAQSADPAQMLGIIPHNERPRVVQASNLAAPVSVVAVASFMILLGSILIFLLFWRLAGWPLVVAALPSLLTFFGAGWYALILLNGDLPAMSEIKEAERTERRRIDAAQAIAVEHYTTQRTHIQAWRDVEMERASADAMRHNMTTQLASVVDSLNRLVTAQGQPALPGPTNYVNANPRPALTAVREWLLALYDDSGKWRNDAVLDSGQLRQRVPFGNTGAWKSEPWGTEARQLLTQAQHSKPPVIVSITDSAGTHKGWRVSAEYAEMDTAVRWLAAF